MSSSWRKSFSPFERHLEARKVEAKDIQALLNQLPAHVELLELHQAPYGMLPELRIRLLFKQTTSKERLA